MRRAPLAPRNSPGLALLLTALAFAAHGATGPLCMRGEHDDARRATDGGLGQLARHHVEALRTGSKNPRTQLESGRWSGAGTHGLWRYPEGGYAICTLLGVVALLGLLVLHGRRLRRELRRHQEALEETEARWHFALESSELGVFDWDVGHDQVVYSEQYRKLLGYGSGLRGGPIGQWEKRVHPDDIGPTNAKLHAHLRGESPYYRSEYRMRVADGSYRWFQARGKVLVRDSEGAPVRHLGTLSDISTRKAMELELQHSKDLLERRVSARTNQLAEQVAEAGRANRAMLDLLEDLQATNRKLEEVSASLANTNQELDAFAHSVSHDLRAPLRAIDGFAQILAEEYTDVLDAEGLRLLGVVQDSTRRMGQLIHDLLAFSQLGRRPLEQATVPVREVVQEILANTAHGAKTAAAVKVGDLPDVQGDRAMLRQAFANLLDNAVKYSSPEPNPEITVGGSADEGAVHYWVADNGIGFEPEHAARIFGVFERLHPPERFSGTGVGLSLVQRIVRRHGGSVWAEGEPGKGATFHLRLPADPMPPAPTDPSSEPVDT